MNSLEELNAYSKTSISVTDERPANVIFDRSLEYIRARRVFEIYYDGDPWEISFPGRIEEIINWETAKAYYMVEVFSDDPDLYDSTEILFNVIPGGITEEYSELESIIEDEANIEPLGRVGFKVQYFKTREEWEQFGRGTFTWIQPSINELNTSLIYYIRVSFNWTDAETNTQEKIRFEVYDPNWYYDVNMQSEFTFAGDFNQTKAVVANLVASGGLLSASTGRIAASAALVSLSSITIATRVFYKLTTNINSLFNLGITDQLIKGIVGMNDRTYISNTGNNLFATNSPIVNDINPAAQITITLTSTNGEFGSSTSASPSYSFTGSINQVNDNWDDIVFYPNKNLTSTLTFTYTQAVGGVTRITKTVSLAYAGAATPPTNSYQFLESNTWIPTVIERKYCVFDLLLVGGGGAGGSGFDTGTGVNLTAGAGGGGGAAVVYQTNLPINSSSYNFTVGSGGQPRLYSTNLNGEIGETTSGFGFTAAGGGYGGRPSSGGSTYGTAGRGGENATGSGGGYGTSRNNNLYPLAGGGGSGAGGGGTYAVENSDISQNPGVGGSGVTYSSIYPSTLAIGGGGGYGYRPLIGEKGSGERGISPGTPGSGGGGGGGGGSNGGAGQTLGAPGQNGLIVVKTRP